MRARMQKSKIGFFYVYCFVCFILQKSKRGIFMFFALFASSSGVLIFFGGQLGKCCWAVKCILNSNKRYK
jgi:hypothetical protein